jgi:hypothetical protein
MDLKWALRKIGSFFKDVCNKTATNPSLMWAQHVGMFQWRAYRQGGHAVVASSYERCQTLRFHERQGNSILYERHIVALRFYFTYHTGDLSWIRILSIFTEILVPCGFL